MIGLVPKTENEFVEIFSGESRKERGLLLWKEPEDKWCCWRQILVLSRNMEVEKHVDVLAYVPKEAISFFDQYT